MKRWRTFVALALTVLLTLVCLCGCHGGVSVSELTITDAGGAGTRVCYLYSPVVNRSYFTSCDALVDHLHQFLSRALETDSSSFTIAYEGVTKADDAPLVDPLYEMTDEERAQGYDVFSLSYSFYNIRDYNRKTRMLYDLSKSMAMQETDDTYRVGILDDYVDAVLRVKEITDAHGEPTGLCDVTLTETGSVSYGLVAWAVMALYQQRTNTTLWTTDEIYYAPFSPDETHTLFSALKTQLTVTVGDTVRTVTPITGPLVEGQGEVEGIVFNVSGVLRQAPPSGIHPRWYYIGGGVLALLIAAIVLMLLLVRRKKALAGRSAE